MPCGNISPGWDTKVTLNFLKLLVDIFLFSVFLYICAVYLATSSQDISYWRFIWRCFDITIAYYEIDRSKASHTNRCFWSSKNKTSASSFAYTSPWYKIQFLENSPFWREEHIKRMSWASRYWLTSYVFSTCWNHAPDDSIQVLPQRDSTKCCVTEAT